MNPYPHGFPVDTVRECGCSPQEMTRYRSRVSGLLDDRLDLVVEVPAVPPDVTAATMVNHASSHGHGSLAARDIVTFIEDRELTKKRAINTSDEGSDQRAAFKRDTGGLVLKKANRSI